MHGFNTLISFNNKIDDNLRFCWKPTFDFQQNHVLRVHKTEYVNIEQFSVDKFRENKLWIDNEDFFIVTDGVITNINELTEKYSVSSNEELIVKMLRQKDFFKDFRGHFVGFLLLKKQNIMLAFNNHSGSKKLFYYTGNGVVIVGTDLYTVSKTLESMSVSITHNIDAATFLLTSGFMHENHSHINEVKQIRAGEYLEATKDSSKSSFYFHLSDIKENNHSQTEIIENLDKKFTKAIEREFSIDKESALVSLTTLSGGLDSRMVALIAKENGYNNQLWFNFSEKGYADEVIAKQIAKYYKQEFYGIKISANCLLDIDNVVSVNDGLTLYTGAGHVYNSVSRLKTNNNGLIHTGILGDALLGSYLNSTVKDKVQINSGMYSGFLFKKRSNVFTKYIANYSDIEEYKFYNRGFNGINNGFLFFDLIGESCSAFLDADFMSYALSIPAYFRYKEKIYIDWIKSKHPDAAKFTWEAIGGKPTNSNLLRFYYRAKRAIIKRLPVRSMWKNNMTPEQYWYDNNIEVRNYLDNYFSEHFHLLSFNKELADDCKSMYQNGNITEKAQVLTLLAAYKLLF